MPVGGKNLGGDIGAALAIAEKLSNRLVAAFEEECEVFVVGNKGAGIRELTFIAYAIAFGKVQRNDKLIELGGGIVNAALFGLPALVGIDPAEILKGFIPPPGIMTLQYNLVEKEVHFMLRLSYPNVENVVGGLPGSGNEMTHGADDTIRGGMFDWWRSGGVAPKWVQDFIGVTNLNPLPNPPDLNTWFNKAILTPLDRKNQIPIEEPGPPGDGGLRGTFVEKLIHQALEDPCKPPQPPQPHPYTEP